MGYVSLQEGSSKKNLKSYQNPKPEAGSSEPTIMAMLWGDVAKLRGGIMLERSRCFFLWKFHVQLQSE